MAPYVKGQDAYIKATNTLKSQKVNLAMQMKSMLRIKHSILQLLAKQ